MLFVVCLHDCKIGSLFGIDVKLSNIGAFKGFGVAHNRIYFVHMLTPSLEGLRAKSFVGTVVETPLALVIVAVADVPALIMRDTAAEGVHRRTAYDLASGQVDSPVSLSVHDVYLVSMYSEGEACSRDKATTYPRLPSGRPPFSVIILYHKGIGIW